MMKKLLTLLLLTTSITFGQIPTSLIETTNTINKFDDYQGSIFKNISFKNANVIDEKSGTFEVKLRYNIYLDDLEFSKGHELYKVVKTPTVHARIDQDYYYYCTFEDQRNRNKEGFYILVELGDSYRIYKKISLDITHPKSQKNRIGSGEPDPGKLRQKITYYLEQNGIILELPLDKKGLVATFGDMENELKEYIKYEKIRPRKEEDLKRLVAKYNALKNINSNVSKSLLSNN